MIQASSIDQEARALVPEPLLDPVEEVEQHGDEILLPQRHQVAHLEDLEAAAAQTVDRRVQETAQAPRQGVVVQAVPELVILERVHEVGQRAGRALPEELQGPVERLALPRGDADPLEGQGGLEPLLRPEPLDQRVHPRQRGEPERLIGLAQRGRSSRRRTRARGRRPSSPCRTGRPGRPGSGRTGP